MANGYRSPLDIGTSRFFTLNHAVNISGVPAEEIMRAGEAHEFGYSLATGLIDPGSFAAWVDRRYIVEVREVRKMFAQLVFKIGLLQREIMDLRVSIRGAETRSVA